MKKLLATILIAGTLLSTVSAAKKPAASKKKAATEEVEQIFAVSTYKTTEGNLDDYLEFGGDVASVNAVDVMPDVNGKVSRISVSVGDMVSKDQVIAYVDASKAGMNYSASPVKSPISGRVISLPATLGATVSPAFSIAKVARTDDLEVKINVAERFISRISNKQAATITFDAYPGVEFGAKITEVSPVLDTATRTMAVKLRFNSKDERIKVGMFARVKLITESVKNAIVIPNNAIVTRDGKQYVFVIASQKSGDKPATVRFAPITVGISVDNKTEIVKGLDAGEEIVIKGQTILNDGVNVNIISVQNQ